LRHGHRLLVFQAPELSPTVAFADHVIAQAAGLLKLNEIKFLGVVAEDPLVCYSGTLQKFKVDTGPETTQITIIATSLLKGKVVQLYLFAPYTGGQSITQLLAKQRINVGQLQRANRN
jgi:hypothetical protein